MERKFDQKNRVIVSRKRILLPQDFFVISECAPDDLSKLIENNFEGFDLSRAEIETLKTLSQNPDAKAKDIANLMGAKINTITKRLFTSAWKIYHAKNRNS